MSEYTRFRILYEEDDYAFKMDAKTIRKVFQEIVLYEAVQIQRQYKTMTSKWKRDTITGKGRRLASSVIRRRLGSGRGVRGERGAVYCATGVDDPYCVINFLDSGTKNRYRGMSYNWTSKTSPGGGLYTNLGRGWATSNWSLTDYPSIGARNFRDDIISRRSASYGRRAKKRFIEMIVRAGWT